MKDSYWKKYWKDNPSFKSNNPHVKVARTRFGVPVPENEWKKTLNFLKQKIQLSKNKTVLDLCCGNGLLSIEFAKTAKDVFAIDYSATLIYELKSYEIKNIHTKVADAHTLELPENSYDIIIIYFAIQHFSKSETVKLIAKAKKWLKKGGLIYIGDIPDEERLWDFFYNKEFRSKYYDALVHAKPIIGTWFTKLFFKYLGEYLNFKETEIIKQKKYMINNHSRFDAVLKK